MTDPLTFWQDLGGDFLIAAVFILIMFIARSSYDE